MIGGSRGLSEEMAEGLAEAGASVMICAGRDKNGLTLLWKRFRPKGFQASRKIADASKLKRVDLFDSSVLLHCR